MCDIYCRFDATCVRPLHTCGSSKTALFIVIFEKIPERVLRISVRTAQQKVLELGVMCPLEGSQMHLMQ